ncbi:MAG: methyltransferase [Pirellulales bacterium]
MSNHYFKFKQFTIQQDRCAMKVSTDACFQGAWTPIDDGVRSVLDIGTGTGLLSLMLAQRNADIEVEAIELDEAAAGQAQENAFASPWKNRDELIHADARTYDFRKRYDMAICNPPFYSNSLLGDTESRNHARHTIALSHPELLRVLDRVLAPDGYASILLPVVEHQAWEELLNEHGWKIHRRLCIYHQEESPANRIVSLCKRQNTDEAEEEKLIIFVAEKQYSRDAVELLKPFYLKL